MNRQLIGWIVAAVLAVALGGVLVWEVASGDGGESRTAALASGGQQGLPNAVSADFNQTQDEKAGERGDLPELENPADAPEVSVNPANTCDPNLEPNAFPEYRNSPADLQEAQGMSDQIVVGTAVGEKAAGGFSAKSAEHNGVIQTPVTNVTIHVDQVVSGSGSQGSNITIQRLGDAAGCFRAAGEERFQAGEQYLLLLEDGAGNRPPHVISPEGRYQVTDGELQADKENTFGAEVSGQTLNEVVAELRR